MLTGMFFPRYIFSNVRKRFFPNLEYLDACIRGTELEDLLSSAHTQKSPSNPARKNYTAHSLHSAKLEKPSCSGMENGSLCYDFISSLMNDEKDRDDIEMSYSFLPSS